MADYLVTDTELTSVANAIRTKGGTSANLSFPTEFVSAIDAIPTGGGGASNLVTGTFTTPPSAGVSSTAVRYSGSGYPIACMVFVEGGAYVSGTNWYTVIQRYAIGFWSMSKSNQSTAPSYTTSGTQNQGVVTAIYKNSTSSSTSYTRTSAMNTNVYSSNNASNSAVNSIKFKSKNTLSYYTNTSSYGLLPDTTYRYYIIYSS